MFNMFQDIDNACIKLISLNMIPFYSRTLELRKESCSHVIKHYSNMNYNLHFCIFYCTYTIIEFFN